MALKELEFDRVYEIHVARGRVLWWDLVHMVMEIRSP
jgi:hypothetical protein